MSERSSRPGYYFRSGSWPRYCTVFASQITGVPAESAPCICLSNPLKRDDRLFPTSSVTSASCIWDERYANAFAEKMTHKKIEESLDLGQFLFKKMRTENGRDLTHVPV
jgi:hypothetical protein